MCGLAMPREAYLFGLVGDRMCFSLRLDAISGDRPVTGNRNCHAFCLRSFLKSL